MGGDCVRQIASAHLVNLDPRQDLLGREALHERHAGSGRLKERLLMHDRAAEVRSDARRCVEQLAVIPSVIFRVVDI